MPPFFTGLTSQEPRAGTSSWAPRDPPTVFYPSYKGEGKLILSLAKSDQAVAGDVVRVEVKKLKFVKDVDR